MLLLGGVCYKIYDGVCFNEREMVLNKRKSAQPPIRFSPRRKTQQNEYETPFTASRSLFDDK